MTVLSLSERIASLGAVHSAALAVSSNYGSLTYQDLALRSRTLAEYLRGLGVGPDVVVGLCMHRSPGMIVAALAILRAGGAYLPIDAADPEERLAFLLKDAEVDILITNKVSKNKSLERGRRIIIVSSLGWMTESFANQRDAALPSLEDKVQTKEENPTVQLDSLHSTSPAATKKSLAYVIYTSGSTGEPKGVEVTQGSLCNLVEWHQQAFNITASDRATQLARVGFDAAVWEIWPYLAAGASVHLPPEDTLKDPLALRDWLLAQSISISFVPTPMMERLLALAWPSQSALRIMLTGGDALHRYPPASLPFTLVNNYGPTECCVVATSCIVEPQKGTDTLPPIGFPINNTQLYVLDEAMRPVAPGAPGELYIGGAGVARGYRGRPQLTAQRFVSNPFADANSDRLYKTGDLVKSLPDGRVAYLGRMDEQIKVRGFRIEPHEIVAVLDSHPAISQSAVIARETATGERQLVAYLVWSNGLAPLPSELRSFLTARLPDYMVPSAFVRLDTLPLTANGKVDREALPPPDAANRLLEETFTAPATELERKVVGILGPLLGIEEVDTRANFFALGGHSLLGTQLIARLRDAFGVDLPLRAVFEAPSVSELSSAIERLLVAQLEAMSEDEAQKLLGATPPAYAV